ncbi:MAG: putative signal transduction histidine kinase [Acidimicrobiales bacterium]|nr:putative signal transduction histidine kinase [Acidimicrobiales bacterium]
MTAIESPLDRVDRFVHEALLYAGRDELVAAIGPAIRDAVMRGQAVMVAVDDAKIAELRSALGAHADAVEFVEMAALGRNPGRIIPAWIDFVEQHAPTGRGMLGIGEPVWAERTPAELVECVRHEALLNVAFDGGPAWRLLCPYDTDTLAPEVIGEAACTHPTVAHGGASETSHTYCEVGAAFDAPLARPAGDVTVLALDGDQSMRAARAVVTAEAAEAGFGPAPSGDLILAVNELVANVVDHGGGHGSLSVWREQGSVVCEVAGGGSICDPLAGRRRPVPAQSRGRGLWLVHQLCDLVELRTAPSGTRVRVRIADRG